MNDNTTTENTAYTNLASALAEKTGIDAESANKVVTWLVVEGVLDAPVVTEEFSEGVRD